MKNRIQIFACVLLATLFVQGNLLAQKPLAIKAGKIITMAGKPIKDGTIIIRDGRIAAVGKDLKVPVEAQVIDASDSVVMPGFVEAHTSSGLSTSNESNPMVPYVSVMDSIDPMNSYFPEARRNGITSAAITPGNSTMIGGQAAAIKTGGEFVDDMILKSDIGVKISLRPTRGSRMSHLAKLRKALDDARDKLKKKDESKDSDSKQEKKAEDKSEKKGDSDKSKTEAKPAEKKETKPKEDSDLDKAMFALLKGKLPAIIYCDKAMDVGQAMRLIEEYKLDAKLVLGRECYKAADQIAKLKMPVVIDPTIVYWETDPRTQEDEKIVVTEAFRKHNVPFAFQVSRSTSATVGTNFLWYQAATAIKYGMSKQEALEALTLTPAKMHKIDKYVGSIEKGKDADLVVLSGEPLQIDTWVEKTIVNGVIVYEKEKDDQLRQLLTGEEQDSE